MAHNTESNTKKLKCPCPLVPGGLCPPECITNDGPLCDFDDNCPYLLKRKHEEDVINDTN